MGGWEGIALGEALALGAVVAAVVAAAGYATRALTGSGALAAWVVGAVVLGLGGVAWAGVIVVFFVGSSLLSRVGQEIKARPAPMFAKGTRRDAGQVLANGAVATMLAAAHGLLPLAEVDGGALSADALFVAFVGAVAAVTADTWATELGLLSEAPPVKITTGETVERGTSGGVTALGTVAATAGGTLIGLAAALLFAMRDMLAFGIYQAAMMDFGPEALRILPIAAVAGLASAAFDSLLGATVQGVYWSDSLRRETERPRSAEGEPHVLIHGARWIHNDLVNLAASALGAALAWVLWLAW